MHAWQGLGGGGGEKYNCPTQKQRRAIKCEKVHKKVQLPTIICQGPGTRVCLHNYTMFFPGWMGDGGRGGGGIGPPPNSWVALITVQLYWGGGVLNGLNQVLNVLKQSRSEVDV